MDWLYDLVKRIEREAQELNLICCVSGLVLTGDLVPAPLATSYLKEISHRAELGGGQFTVPLGSQLPPITGSQREEIRRKYLEEYGENDEEVQFTRMALRNVTIYGGNQRFQLPYLIVSLPHVTAAIVGRLGE